MAYLGLKQVSVIAGALLGSMLLSGCASVRAQHGAGAQQIQAQQPGAVFDTIALKSGASFSGRVLRREGTLLTLALDRAQVAAVNGETLPDPIIAGAKAPEFTVTGLDGMPYAVKAGSPVTLVKFWATWCPYCRRDIPIVKDLYARYTSNGLRVLALSVDQEGEVVAPFVEAQGITYPVVALADQPGMSLRDIPEAYESQGVPRYFLIDTRGRVVMVQSGSIQDRVDALESSIREQLHLQ